MWRFRGTPHYLAAQGRRLGISSKLTDQARHSKEIYGISVLLAQLCERYHRLKAGDDSRPIPARDLAEVRGTLSLCELDADKLHALAAASHTMLDEAYLEFGLPLPERHFCVMCDFDDCTAGKAPLTLGPDGNGVLTVTRSDDPGSGYTIKESADGSHSILTGTDCGCVVKGH
jgi:hypothetical protein